MATLSDIARAIFRQEGALDRDGNWNTGSLAYRLKNPGNLAYAGQPGATPVTLWDPMAKTNITYAQFGTLEQGIAATERQLALDASRGLTLAQRLSTWATGNRAQYLANVSSWTGVAPSTRLADLATANPPRAPRAGRAPGASKTTAAPGLPSTPPRK